VSVSRYASALLGVLLTSCPYPLSGGAYERISPPLSPRPIAGVNSPFNDYNSAADFETREAELIFSSDRGKNRQFDLWSAKLYFTQDEASATDRPKRYLPEAMSAGNEFGPALAGANAKRLVFASDRSGGQGKLDLWFYPISGQHGPRQLAGVNTPHNEAYWTALPDAEDAYFASDRGSGNYDIYRLTPQFGGETPIVEHVSELASAADDTAPHIFTIEREVGEPFRVRLNPGRKRAPASAKKVTETFLLFASKRRGGFDLYCSRLEGRRWSAPRPLPINTGFEEFRPIVLFDAQVIVFSSNRPGGMGGMDLYYAAFDNPCFEDT
jgi:hypothetical protein